MYDNQVLKLLEKNTKRTSEKEYYGQNVEDSEEFIELHKNDYNFGWVIPSGVFVLDVDNHKKSEGSISLERLKSDYNLKLTLSVTTAGGGQHYYCHLPDFFSEKLKHKIPGYSGLELLREGQTILIPPSVINGNKYNLHSTRFNELPQELLDKCVKADFIDDMEEVPEDQLKAVLSYVRRILVYVSGEDYIDWWAVGNALKALGEECFGLFHSWSRKQPGYISEKDCREHWIKGMTGNCSYRVIENMAWNSVCEGLSFSTRDEEVQKWVKRMCYFHDAYERSYSGYALRIPTSKLLTNKLGKVIVRDMKAMVSYIPTEEELKYYNANRLEKLIYVFGNQLWNRKENRLYKLNRLNLEKIICYHKNIKTNGFEVWGKTNNHEKVLVEGVCFSPSSWDGKKGGRGDAINIDGKKYIQIFNPESVPKEWQGEYTEKGKRLITCFESLIYAWPEDNKDAEALILFLAAQIRHMGVKVGYAPFIFSTQQGTGKSTIAKITGHCMGPENVLYRSNSALWRRFKAEKIEEHGLAIFDELAFHGVNREPIMDTLKPWITDEIGGKESKGVDEKTIHQNFNIIILSNFKDAITLDETDRRIFPFEILPSSNNQLTELCERLEKELQSRGYSMNGRIFGDWVYEELYPYSKKNPSKNEIRQLSHYLRTLPDVQEMERVKMVLREQVYNETKYTLIDQESDRREWSEQLDDLISLKAPFINEKFVHEGSLLFELRKFNNGRGYTDLNNHTLRKDLQRRGFTMHRQIRGVQVPIDRYMGTCTTEEDRHTSFDKFKGKCLIRTIRIKIHQSSYAGYNEALWRDAINDYNLKGYGWNMIKPEDKTPSQQDKTPSELPQQDKTPSELPPLPRNKKMDKELEENQTLR